LPTAIAAAGAAREAEAAAAEVKTKSRRVIEVMDAFLVPTCRRLWSIANYGQRSMETLKLSLIDALSTLAWAICKNPIAMIPVRPMIEYFYLSVDPHPTAVERGFAALLTRSGFRLTRCSTPSA
jgi:hypothetical protein